jgi:hypothetical protein
MLASTCTRFTETAQLSLRVKFEAGIETVSFASIVFELMVAKYNRFPALEASNTPTAVTTPHEADAVGQEIAFAFDLAPEEAAGKFVVLFVTEARL